VRSIELNTSLFGTRLTSFTPEQSFGMSLPLLAAITLITQVKDRIRYRQIFWIIFTILLLFAAAILNGSRTGLFASIILAFSLIIWPFISKHRRAVGLAYFSLTGIVSLALLFLIFLPTEQVKAALSSNRALLGIAVLLDSNASITDLGTAQFRVSMYQTAITNYLEKPAVYKVIGSGTSSAATLITEGHIRYRGYTSETVDANRVVHNEFLRILYEWGIVGAVLWGFAFLTIAYKLGKVASRMQILGNYVLLVSFMLIFLFLMVENVISSSGTLEGTTISILLAILLHHPDRWGQL
jgi:O-antigen ligase